MVRSPQAPRRRWSATRTNSGLGATAAGEAAELLLRRCVRRFGGVTGDVFGGVAETAATTALVVMSLG
ncbi:hypothetical protein GCM10010478_44260 [Streptomyces erythrogriseus]|uniref:Adenosylcobinamide-GDP ribazoletransferase n=1 Tax=Streptomyces erythrogriseus TaxID=284027 RepID=A0ABN3X7L2_9ACTN